MAKDEQSSPLLGPAPAAEAIPYSATPSSYNFGPRQTTDKGWAVAFLTVLGIFFAWGVIGAATVKKSDGSDFAPFWANFSYVDGEGCVAVKATGTSDAQGLAPTAAIEAVIGFPVALSILAAFALGALLLLGFKKAPEAMVWVVVLCKVVAPAALGIFLLAHGQSSAHVDDSATTLTGGFNIPAIVLIGLSLLLAALFWCMRTTLAVVARLFKVSAGALSETMTMIPLQAGFGFLTMLLTSGMVLLTASYIAYGKVTEQESVDAIGVATTSCQWAFASNATHAYMMFAVFAIYWFMMWALTTRTYIIGDSVSYWYWHGPEQGMLSRACKNAGTTHFGSLAFAGLVLVIIEWMKSIARQKSNNFLVCILQAIVRCILSYIEFLCKMSVILIGITGQPFYAAGKQVVALFTESFGNMAMSTGVWWVPGMVLNFFVLLMSLLWGAGTGMVVYLKVNAMDEEKCGVSEGEGCHDIAVTYGIAVGVACAVVVMYILAFFGNMMSSYIDTVFMCFLIDKSKGVVTKPEIHQVLGVVLERQGKQLQQTPGGQFALAHPPPPAYHATQPTAMP